jgi:DNA-binding transcriptional ArsR family regulator
MDIDTVFKALADPTRRQILDSLFETRGQTLGEICAHLSIKRQSVSKHLALLEAAGLVVIQWHGREKLHTINPVPIQEIYERWIAKYERQQLQALTNLKHTLETDQKEHNDGG